MPKLIFGAWTGFFITTILIHGSMTPDVARGDELDMDNTRFRFLREEMVKNQISHPPDYREPIRDKKILSAMRSTPRHLFVQSHQTSRAYGDYPLPIGYGQTISQPYIVALMTEMLKVSSDHKVLEVGTGSGYQAAILSGLVADVYSELKGAVLHRL